MQIFSGKEADKKERKEKGSKQQATSNRQASQEGYKGHGTRYKKKYRRHAQSFRP
jgi:hypothetical protein